MTDSTDRTWVIDLAKQFSDGGWKVVEIRTPDLSISLSDGSVAAPAAAPVSPAAPAAQAPVPEPAPTAAPTPVPAATETATDATDTITAPGVGVFWSRPKPEDPPFVAVGDTVTVGQTIGLLEVMKMFTEVKADKAGTVVDIVDDATFVEFGQTVVTLSGGEGSDG
ncbi:MAG: biotin/lipoyl-containing protein [Propionibacteriaceae bacterium]|nr:biotin/lipoyl-containing protein [Propionibacteriaceae bacterium]